MGIGGNKTWRIRSKLWLEVSGHPVIGEGRMEMLQAIHQHGSIIQASRETGIAYRKIRGAIRDMENILDRPMVRAYRGGREQGGAILTDDAYELMESYTKIAENLQKEVDNKLQKFFK